MSSVKSLIIEYCMCQVFIVKIISDEMRVDKMQLSGSRVTYRYSKAHRRAAVLERLSIESEIVARAP